MSFPVDRSITVSAPHKVAHRSFSTSSSVPLVTVIALGLPRLLGGTIIVEAIFAWPGMGTLAITAVRARDYPVLMAINLISDVKGERHVDHDAMPRPEAPAT